MIKNNKHDLTHIRQMGFRVTPQRELILEAIRQQGGHVTVSEVYQFAKKRMPGLNQATVYRVLDFFCKLNLVVRSDMAGQVMYEFVGEDPHHHLLCLQCGGVQVLADHHFTELVTHLFEEHHFQAELKHLAIPGTCGTCQNK